MASAKCGVKRILLQLFAKHSCCLTLNFEAIVFKMHTFSMVTMNHLRIKHSGPKHWFSNDFFLTLAHLVVPERSAWLAAPRIALRINNVRYHGIQKTIRWIAAGNFLVITSFIYTNVAVSDASYQHDLLRQE